MILSREEMITERTRLRRAGKSLVFTNGCFDILHRGHVEYLTEARNLGDALVVAMNSDQSVKRLKGEKRPIVNEQDRAVVLNAVKPVDYVVMFTEDTPYELIVALQPDVLVKGGDWNVESIVGRDIVESSGGVVRTIPITAGRSSTNIIETIKARLL